MITDFLVRLAIGVALYFLVRPKPGFSPSPVLNGRQWLAWAILLSAFAYYPHNLGLAEEVARRLLGVVVLGTIAFCIGAAIGWKKRCAKAEPSSKLRTSGHRVPAIHQTVVQDMPSASRRSSDQFPENASDDWAYEQVANELESGNKDKAAWTRAFADAGGDEKLATANYIKIRTKRLLIDQEDPTQITDPAISEVTVKSQHRPKDLLPTKYAEWFDASKVLIVLTMLISALYFGFNPNKAENTEKQGAKTFSPTPSAAFEQQSGNSTSRSIQVPQEPTLIPYAEFQRKYVDDSVSSKEPHNSISAIKPTSADLEAAWLCKGTPIKQGKRITAPSDSYVLTTFALKDGALFADESAYLREVSIGRYEITSDHQTALSVTIIENGQPPKSAILIDPKTLRFSNGMTCYESMIPLAARARPIANGAK